MNNKLLFLLIFQLFSSITFSQEKLNPGDQSPDWTLEREDSSLISLDSIESEYVLLLFWHYKCGHCHNALDKIDRFLEKEKPKELKIVSIYPFATDKEAFWRFVQDPDHLLTDPIYIHTTDYKAMTRRAFGLKGSPPLLVLLKKDGTIINLGFKAKELRKIWKSREEVQK